VLCMPNIRAHRFVKALIRQEENLFGQPNTRRTMCLAFVCVLAFLVSAGHCAAAGNTVDSATYQGWKTVRQLDCARCHGRDFTGSVGPSLIASAQTRSAEEFKRLVLEGVPERGMPPYRSVASVLANIDGIYAYFLGRAQGTIMPGLLREEAP
jgi:cytochrome c55X